ncbi:MAG: holo-ACP synthase [Ardenticatenaceae bacterium]|nr:holo-ACP synthase [Ardenticatenaceae bacterium]MCB9446245.1 holo-ACP synthase [Ardenticatenaceae bacterium]
MLRTGVDIVEIERVKRVMARSSQRFLDRIFTPQEQAYCQDRIPSLAGRFAVKEAVAKALGTGIGEMTWVEIEVVSDKMGRPELVLHGAAQQLADKLGLVEWSISLSHTETYAVGFAVAAGRLLPE